MKIEKAVREMRRVWRTGLIVGFILGVCFGTLVMVVIL